MGVAGKALFLFLILLGIRLWIKKVLDIEKDNKKIETTLEIMNQSYTELQEQIDAARKYRHDIPQASSHNGRSRFRSFGWKVLR